ncbi:ubiquinone oxidoreductase, Na(+)-translocating, E subunit, partial [Chlamydia psittaci C6/98]
NQKSLFGRSQ